MPALTRMNREHHSGADSDTANVTYAPVVHGGVQGSPFGTWEDLHVVCSHKYGIDQAVSGWRVLLKAPSRM